MGDAHLQASRLKNYPPTLPRTMDTKNPITVARYKLLGPQLFYEWCDSLEPCPRIGWTTNTNTQPEVVAYILNNSYFNIRTKSYDYNALDLDFWSSTKLRPSPYDFVEGLNSIQFVSLSQRHGLPLCLPAQLFLSHNHVVDIRLKLGGEWMKFVDFLDLLVLARPVNPARMEHIWKHSGKSFDLLALPRELRDQIWAYTIFYDHHALVAPGPPFAAANKSKALNPTKAHFSKLLLWIRRCPSKFETRQGWLCGLKESSTSKSWRTFSEFFLNIQPENIPMLRKMVLNFGYEGWLRLLGAQLTTRARFTACPSLDVLKTAPLQELKLVFRDPSNLEHTRYGL